MHLASAGLNATLTQLLGMYAYSHPYRGESDWSKRGLMRVFKIPRVLQILEDIAVTFLSLFFALRYAGPTWHEGALGAHVAWLTSNWFEFATVLTVFITGSKISRYALGDRLTNRKEIKGVLDSLHKSFFQGIDNEDQFKHRVTLFKAYGRFRYVPWGRLRFLRVYARSGTRYQQSATCFEIDDESESGNQGVAGRAWFTDAQATVADLPCWPDSVVRGNDKICQKYAKDGNITIELANNLGIKSRSISATVVRNKSGERWGVLVLDSREPAGVALNQEKKAMVALVADLLSPQL